MPSEVQLLPVSSIILTRVGMDRADVSESGTSVSFGPFLQW